MNMWLRFPRGTVSHGSMPKAELIARLRHFSTISELSPILRGDDTFELLGLTAENWRSSTALVKQMFPEATRFQKV